MANLIGLGDTIIDADEIVWLNAKEDQWHETFTIEYYLRGNSIGFNANFHSKELRDECYLNIKSMMQKR